MRQFSDIEGFFAVLLPAPQAARPQEIPVAGQQFLQAGPGDIGQADFRCGERRRALRLQQRGNERRWG